MKGTCIDISKALEIQGWMNEFELEWLAEHARPCSIIVEFGCHLGRSTRALADNTDGIIYAVDPWNGFYPDKNNNFYVYNIEDHYPNFSKNLSDYIEIGKVKPFKCHSYHFWMKEQADLVFIDGDHRYDSVVEDIDIAWKLTKPGGIISGHDYGQLGHPGVKEAVDESFGNKIQVKESIWWIQKS